MKFGTNGDHKPFLLEATVTLFQTEYFHEYKSTQYTAYSCCRALIGSDNSELSLSSGSFTATLLLKIFLFIIQKSKTNPNFLVICVLTPLFSLEMKAVSLKCSTSRFEFVQQGHLATLR